MKLFRCQICGDPILQLEKPSCCPFCGAHQQHIVLAANYKQPVIDEMSDVSQGNLEKALSIEVSNSKFYKCASDNAEDDYAKQLFRALSKIEAEHASTIAKALEATKPGMEASLEDCFASTDENYEDAKRRETNASRFYTQAALEASEARVIEIFSALVEIENDHLEILSLIHTQNPDEEPSLYS